MMNKKYVIGWMLFLCGSSLCAQTKTALSAPVYERPLPAVTGWADGSRYLERRTEGKKTTWYAVDALTGKEHPWTWPDRELKPTVKVADGEVYYFGKQGKKRLTDTEAVEKNPVLSPDGKWVAFTRENDLYAVEVASGREIRYTSDGSEVVKNGYASWVYYEEILGRSSNYCSFWWSPDSRHIAFFRCDDSTVPVFPLYNAQGWHGYTEYTRYPKAGDPNPEVKVGIVPLEGGKVVWADFNAKEDQYFGQPFWRPDGSSLLVQWMPREQNNLKLYEVKPQTGDKKEIYDEKQPTWVDWISGIHWIKDGFLMIRDFEGWEQIYWYRPEDSLCRKLTGGRKWNTKILKVDEREKKVYFTSCGELSTRTDFYCVSFNGKEQRLTFGEYSHKNISLSPDNRFFITRYENVNTPPRIAVVQVKTGKVRVIGDSRPTGFDPEQFARTEMLWLKTPEGFDLPASITWPHPFEEGKKYPVVIQVYGGPNAGTVSERWLPLRYRESVNCIGIAIDHRGSGHCGKAGMNYMHRNLGKWEMEDYIAWVKYLRTFPGVDGKKVMISGGSYGGYVTALALTYGCEYFQYGYAKYGVMDWRLYDSHYTERYMDRPQDNPEGYQAASVLTYAGRYQTHGPAMLRIIHGMMDDNVHVQNSIQLVDTLQQLNKTFELMLFPDERHGWMRAKGEYTSGDYQRFLNNYLWKE